MLDYFALVVLLVLIGVLIAAWIMLGMMPGQIARKRGHPQAEAINVCGWWGAITMGLLAPIAWVWAYTNPVARPVELPAPAAPEEAPADDGGEKVTS